MGRGDGGTAAESRGTAEGSGGTVLGDWRGETGEVEDCRGESGEGSRESRGTGERLVRDSKGVRWSRCSWYTPPLGAVQEGFDIVKQIYRTKA